MSEWYPFLTGVAIASIAFCVGWFAERGHRDCAQCPRVLEALADAREARCDGCRVYREFAAYLRADGAPEDWVAAIPRAMCADGWKPV